mgnify:CR=1 FL=1
MEELDLKELISMFLEKKLLIILVVIYYLVYLFLLNATYPTFMDAVYALSNPQNVINNILSSS